MPAPRQSQSSLPWVFFGHFSKDLKSWRVYICFLWFIKGFTDFTVKNIVCRHPIHNFPMVALASFFLSCLTWAKLFLLHFKRSFYNAKLFMCPLHLLFFWQNHIAVMLLFPGLSLNTLLCSRFFPAHQSLSWMALQKQT